MSSTSCSTGKGGLVPGFKHVEQFGADEDYDYEDDDDSDADEFYVTLDLGSVDHTLVPSSSSYRLIGLDTMNPFLQLSGTIMRGYHQSLIGTELVFKDVTEEEEDSKDVRYFTKTDRRIVFREVELKKPKTESGASSANTGDAPPASSHKENKKRRHVDISSLYFINPVGESAGETSSAGAGASASVVLGTSTAPVAQGIEVEATATTTAAEMELSATAQSDGSSDQPSKDQHMDVDE